MRVYVVTRGCYSDYSIITVFLEKEKAFAYCNAHNYGGGLDVERYNVEEYTVSDEEHPLNKVGVWGYFSKGTLKRLAVIPRIFKNFGFWQSARSDTDVYFEGDLLIRKGEGLEAFEKRARKVVCDKYYEYLERGGLSAKGDKSAD